MNVKRVKIGFKPNDVELKIVKRDHDRAQDNSTNLLNVISEENKEYQTRRKQFQQDLEGGEMATRGRIQNS